MSYTAPKGPQGSLLFRFVALFARLQLGYLIRTTGNAQLLALFFLFAAGTTALGIITAAAYLTRLPLLFPPLGPSAFILFHTPMSATASPRSVFLSHTMGVAAGLLSLRLVGLFWQQGGLTAPTMLNAYRVVAIALAMGLTGVMMVVLRCVHPPAAASALIAAMGYLGGPLQVLGLLAAVVLLILEAFLFIRLFGGLPYPLWRADPSISMGYGVLAGIPQENRTFWQQLSTRIFQRR